MNDTVKPDRKPDQPRWLVIVTSLLGLAVTGLSLFTSYQTYQLDSRLKQIEEERKTIELRTSLQLKLFEKVDSTLTALAGKRSDAGTTEKRYRAVSALVAGMKGSIRDDEFIGGLLQALELDAPAGSAREEIGRIKFDAEIVDKEAPPPPKKTSSLNEIGDVLAELISPSAVAAPLSQPTLNLGGASLDIFYCTKASDATGNTARREVAKTLFDGLQPLGSRGRLRLRELPAGVNSRPGYGLNDNEIRFDPDEKQIADQLAVWANQGVPSLTVKPRLVTAAPTPNYLSIFVCRGGS